MNNVSRAYIYIIMTLAASLCFTSAWADKRDKDKKNKQAVTIVTWEPDPVARKSRPDRHPAVLEMPHLGTSSSSYNVAGGRGTGGSEAHGIDVSHYQGRINWDEVARDSRVTYVYLKATEGTNTIDDTYTYNFTECKRVGLKVGSYLFFRPHLSAQAQFDLFKSRVNTRQQDLLPVIDVEVIRGVSECRLVCSNSATSSNVSTARSPSSIQARTSTTNTYTEITGYVPTNISSPPTLSLSPTSMATMIMSCGNTLPPVQSGASEATWT